MIARVWRGSTLPVNAERYVAHLREKTFPGLRAIRGHRGAYVLRRPAAGSVDFTVVTLWDSLDAIRQFAGGDPEAAVVPDEARMLLASYDERALHWEVALDNVRDAGAK